MRRLINHIELLILFTIIYAIAPPQDGQIPQKYQEYFKNNNIGKDYGNSAWQYRLHRKQLARSTEVDSFFIPVIMANYSDFGGTINSTIYKEHLFGNNSTGSFADYYKEVSYNKFYPTGDVYGWYNTTLSKSQAVEDSRSFVVSALEFSDNDIDFSIYDNDGPDNIPNSGDDDGYVDGVFIIYPGNGADSGIDEDNIWPFKWSLWDDYEYITNDLSTNGSYIKVLDFALFPEKYYSNIRSIGVYVHEFGHILGLPDLYDTTNEEDDPSHNFHEGIGNWGVMATGSWLGNAGDTPSHLSAWSKIKLGWVDPIEITTGSYILSPVENSDMIYKIIGVNYIEDPVAYNNEYFLFENRQLIGFDKELPGDGMLIFHIDESMWNNSNQNQKKVDVEEADGDDDLDDGVNRGDDGDPYPGMSYNTSFTSASYPNNYNYNNTSSAFDITNIQINGNDISFEMENDIITGEQITYDTDYNYSGWGWETERDIYAGVLFQSNISGNIKGIDIKLPGEYLQNSDGNWEYVDKWHTFEILIYDNLDGDGYAQNLLYSQNISVNTQGWHHIDIDSNLLVNSGEEFFIVYKIPNGTYDIYIDRDEENLSNRSYVKWEGGLSYFQAIDYGNITLRSWINNSNISYPPSEFSIIYPDNGAKITEQTPLLDWEQSTDPEENDIITYTLFFGNNPSDLQIIETGFNNYFQITEELIIDNTYYWKVTANDTEGNNIENSGGLHAFTVISLEYCIPGDFVVTSENNIVNLSWDTRPGEYEELRYFTSWWQSSYLWYATLSEGAGHGVLFTPAGTYDIDSVHVGVQWTFPTEEHEGPVAVQIYTESNDMPDELIWSGETSTIIQDLSNDFGTPGTYGWALIYPAISNLSGDIFVFVGQGENWEGEAFLYDWDSDFNGGVADNPDNIYVVENGIFSQGLGSYLNGDPMTATYIRNYGSEESCDYDGFLYHNIYRNGELINTTTLEEYTDILLEEGEHCYQVSNVYESGESELTAQECIGYQNTPPLEFNLLDPVDNSEVTTLTPLLSWEAAIDPDPFDILKYTLYLDTPEPGIMNIFVDTATSYVIPTLLDNTTYYWKVVATDLFGETIENIGGYHSFIINTANDSPANFELVTPTDGSVEITLTPFFYWEPATDLDPNDIVSYNLYIDLDNLFTDTAPISLDTNTFDYSTLNIFLNDNSSYLWTVNASDNHAAITNTDTLQFWTDQYPEPPEPFGRISPSNDTELDLGNVIFTWQSTIDVDPLDFVQYTLMYTYNGGDTTIIPELLDTTYALELDIDRQYYWHVIASDKDALLTFADGSEGMWSFVLGSLNINELLSLTEYALYNAYPNPFNPVTVIKYAVPEASHLSISIYDMIGREIAELYNGSQVPGFHTVIWDASEISSGIYFAKMIAGEYISTQKLMLIK